MQENIIRFKFFKKAEYKFLSHLDIMRLMMRALSRADIDVIYDRGFNPKPKISFSNPIPLGVESLAEYCDLELGEDVDINDFISRLNLQLPEQVKIISAKKVPHKVPSLMADIDLVLYVFKINTRGQASDGVPEQLSRGLRHTSDKIVSAPDNRADKLKEEIEDDKKGFSNSIFEVEIENTVKNIIFLKVFGYAKILKDVNNTIFKFNNFIGFFAEILKESGLVLDLVMKQEMYILQDGFKKNPLEIV